MIIAIFSPYYTTFTHSNQFYRKLTKNVKFTVKID